MYLVNGKGSVIRIIAGLFVLISALLGLIVSVNFLYFTLLVGLMLFLSGTTGFCPMEMMLNLSNIEKRKTVIK